MKLLVFIIVCCCVLYSKAKPTDEPTQVADVIEIPDCHGVACPSGTAACQMSQTPPKTVYCLNGHEKVLFSAPCPYENGHGDAHGNGHGDAHGNEHGHHGHHGHH